MDVRQLSVVAESWLLITKEAQRRGIEVNIDRALVDRESITITKVIKL